MQHGNSTFRNCARPKLGHREDKSLGLSRTLNATELTTVNILSNLFAILGLLFSSAAPRSLVFTWVATHNKVLTRGLFTVAMPNSETRHQGLRSLSLGQVVLILSATFLALAIVTILVISSFIQKRAVSDLAQEDARLTSQLVFESLYAAMRKGWSKSEISSIIARLNEIDPDMEIRVYRGAVVNRQFGEIAGERAARESDELLQAALTGEEILLPNSEKIRFIFPVRAEQECLQCHTQARVGDINGAIDIVYPIKNLKVSLSFITNVVIGYFIAVLVLLFLVLYLMLRFMVERPVRRLTELIIEITQKTDLTRRVEHTGWISEVRHLSTHFNRLLSSLQTYNQQLEDLSVRDPLTNLYNRRRFERFLAAEVQRGDRHGHKFCLIMLDLDNFKHVNDTFGHPIGDLILRKIAMLLKSQLRKTDILARMGGDEFAIILPDTDQAQGLRAAGKLHQAINETTLELPVGNTRVLASFGLVAFPENGTDADALFTGMDVAMYKAKRLGKNRVMTFDNRDQQVMMEVFSKGEFVRKAIDENRVVPYLQPIVRVETGQLFAYEALARIMDENGVTEATGFIDTAEEVGLAEAIDRRIIDEIMRIKSNAGMAGIKIFCNLSSRSFGDVERMREIVDQMQTLQIPLDEIVFEITEREALPHLSDLRNLTEELRAKGVAFALDDFGSGFSSFLYLKFLKVDYVKIEGSFIRQLALDPKDRIMVDHINRMAQEFQIQTIAEYVEDAEVQEILKQMGVDYAQGYYHGRPRALDSESRRRISTAG
jgi:diguanylate cyclase (GGDEF)-like protein